MANVGKEAWWRGVLRFAKCNARLGKVDVSLAAPQPDNDPILNVFGFSGLAGLMGITAAQLGYFLYRDRKFFRYASFPLPKKSGGIRMISAPEKNLKLMQRHLARELTPVRTLHRCVTGFVPGRGIKENAEVHVGRRTILNVDLQDFFGSINFGRVYGMLSKKPFNLPRGVAAAIAKVATYENKLPQGAPTSPLLSNLICAKLDSELRALSRKHHCNYTRYADDITFSTHRKVFDLATNEIGEGGAITTHLSDELTTIIANNGFRINPQKSRLFVSGQRKEVTGLIVNERVNVKRRYIRNIRGALNAWRKYGFQNAQKAFTEKFGGQKNLDSYLLGQISFVGQIRGKSDQVFRKLVVEFNQLNPSVKIQIKLTQREIAEQATWVIEDRESTAQGTAFFMSEMGIITCSHCVGTKPFIYHRNRPNQEFPLKLKHRDTVRDLALFEIPEELKEITPIELSSKNLSVEPSPNLYLLGYPNHNKIMPIRAEQGDQTRTFNRHGVSYLEITPRIREGNSGGPVLDSSFRVLGIAGKGANYDTPESVAEYIAIAASELTSLLGK